MRLFLLSIFSVLLLKAHSQMIAGKVFDSNTGKPIPYASILSKTEPSKGTVANAEGNFQITVETEASDTLIVSHTSYVAREVPAKGSFLKVPLNQREHALKEIVITPTDPLLDTLRKAFMRIATNYPNSRTLIKGVYRETNQHLPDSIFDYFSEALLEVYKTGYYNKDWGSVKIVEGGIIDNRSESSDILFYGGPFAAHKRDFVKERLEFINPQFFNRYSYTVSDRGDLYEIHFKPGKRAMYQGKFYLDKKSLAYAGAEFSLTNHGIEYKNMFALRKHKYRIAKYTVRYRPVNKEWQLSLAIADGMLEKQKENYRVRFTSEYFATSHESIEKNPFKDSEILTYGEVFSKRSKFFTADFWNKPEVIRRTVASDSMVSSLFKSTDKGKIEGPYSAKSAEVSNSKRIKTLLATRISSSIGVGGLPVALVEGEYSLSMPGNFSLEKRIDRFSLYSVNFDIRYYLRPRTSLNLGVASASSRISHYNQITFGATWHKLINGSKKPLFFEPGLNLNYFAIGASFGETEITNSFQVNGKRFSQGTMKIFFGERRVGIGPNIQFRYKANSKLSFFANASTTLVSVSKNFVFFKQRGSFGRVRSAVSNDEIILLKNNLPEKDGPVSLSAQGLSFIGGLQFGIN